MRKILFTTSNGREAEAVKLYVITHVEMGLEGHENGLVSLVEESLECKDILSGKKFFCPAWVISDDEVEALPHEEIEIVTEHEN